MIRIIGVCLIVAGCGSFGFAMAAAYRQEEQQLHQLLRAVEYMDCELQYRQTALPSLCLNASRVVKGRLAVFFRTLGELLDRQLYADASTCVNAVLGGSIPLAASTLRLLQEFGESLGHFDLEGQSNGLQSVKRQCQQLLNKMNEERDTRVRSYQTLGLCTGAALAILLI